MGLSLSIRHRAIQQPMNRALLIVDGLGNLALGVLLLAVPSQLAAWLGIPETGRFYPSLFGAVLFGIGIALLMELRGHGLGLAGALAINTCFGIALAAWLLFGGVDLPAHGSAILWAFAAILLGLSGIELVSERSPKEESGSTTM